MKYIYNSLNKKGKEMKTFLCFYPQTAYFPRTAIEAKILFAVCLSKKQALTGGKSLAREDKCSKKIGAESAVLTLVYFYIIMIVHKCQQSAKRKLLLNKNNVSEVFPLTVQKAKQYYYHSDHLGSAQFVTDWKGRQYEHIEYTPYGELWIEEVAAGLDKLPFRFTGKELDEETGLYYYGARYLDPKYSRWLSGDPALNDYIPKAPIDDEAKKHNENLPGMGGVYNTINLHVYHYAGNNPVKYTDPDGRDIIYKDDDGNIEKIESSSRNEIHTPASDRELLEENAKEMKKHALNISYFYKKVKSHGDWDFKNFKEEDGKRGWYWFNGKLVTAEEFGNLHYGYVGAAGGFSTLLLIEAPGIAQVKAGTAMAGFWLTNFDDPRDTQNILRGIYAYDGSLGNKITRTIGDHFYLSFCFTSFRMFTFTAFIFENKLKRRK